jgi:hypothetical protein
LPEEEQGSDNDILKLVINETAKSFFDSWENSIREQQQYMQQNLLLGELFRKTPVPPRLQNGIENLPSHTQVQRKQELSKTPKIQAKLHLPFRTMELLLQRLETLRNPKICKEKRRHQKT